jgi:hypothetical protein
LEFGDDPKSKVGDLEKLNDFRFWRFSSCYANLEENERNWKKKK